MSSALAAFRVRRWLFAVLLALVVANAVVLLSYRAFYDSRLRALHGTERTLEDRLAAARKAAERAKGAEAELTAVQERLSRFLDESLGLRRERLAAFIEEIYATTRSFGMRPESINYASTEDRGTDRITLSFNVIGRYADIKKLLAGFESSERFIVLEQVGVAADAVSPDLLNVGLTLTHHFRAQTTRPVKPARPSGARTSRSGASSRRPR